MINGEEFHLMKLDQSGESSRLIPKSLGIVRRPIYNQSRSRVYKCANPTNAHRDTADIDGIIARDTLRARCRLTAGLF